MQKIRVTKTGKTGDQRDYSLVHRQVHYIGEGDSNTPVKNTMGAVPREQANIEVEGGETVIGDVNQDGFLEHMTFVGKRHSEGGMPVNIPDGSFIFSDTKKLRIKDKEVLKNIFGLPDKKGGYTPAEIAKRYQVNNYIQDLKSEDTDAITKRSATEMLKNNMEKLGQLALIQESMKGFPDGIPAIAESVMAGMQGGAEEQPMQEAKMGGMKQYQQAGRVGETFYINGKPHKITKRYEGFFDTVGEGSDEWVTFDKPITLPNGDKISEMLLRDYQQMSKKGKIDLGYNTGSYLVDPEYYTSVDNLGWGNQAISRPGKGNKYFTLNFSSKPNAAAPKEELPKVGQKYSIGNKEFEVVDPAMTDGSGRVVRVKQTADPDRNVGSFIDTYGGYKVIPLDVFQKLTGTAPAQQNFSNPTTAGNPSSSVFERSDVIQEIKKPAQPGTGANRNSGSNRPATRKTTAPKTDDEILNMFEEGGSLEMYQTAGQTGNEIPAGSIKRADGAVRYMFYTDTEKIVKDEKGNIVSRAPITASGFRPHPGDRNPSRNPVTGKVEKGWNKSKYTAEQIEQLARARGYTGPKDNKILQQWIINHPEFSKVVNQLHDKYKMPYAGKEVDGYWGVRWDDALQAIPEKTKEQPAPEKQKPADEPVKEKEVAEQPVASKQERKQGPWWLQDIVNFVGASTDDIDRYEPSQTKVALTTPGYVTEDPTRRLAANQEQMSKIQAQTENTVDGNVGLASMLGASGQGFANAANVLGEVENRNVNIVNQAYANTAAIENQEAMLNEQGRQKYIEDMATLNQQYDNARQMKKWRQIAAFNNGVTNHMRKNLMEQVLFPQVYMDPLTGAVDFSGEGRAYDEPDTYSPSYVTPGSAGAGFNSEAMAEQYKDLVNTFRGTMSEKEAQELARSFVSRSATQSNKVVTGPTGRQEFNAMVQRGMYLPAPQNLGGREQAFGGTLQLPWEEID